MVSDIFIFKTIVLNALAALFFASIVMAHAGPARGPRRAPLLLPDNTRLAPAPGAMPASSLTFSFSVHP
jgi:hypothetical protein